MKFHIHPLKDRIYMRLSGIARRRTGREHRSRRFARHRRLNGILSDAVQVKRLVAT